MTLANLKKLKAHYEKIGYTDALEDLRSKYPELFESEKEE